MKICVLNGSPKGKYSVILQTIRYLEKLYPTHDFVINKEFVYIITDSNDVELFIGQVKII